MIRPPRPSKRGRPLLLANAVALIFGASVGPVAACSTPSESVDGGDLLGVFERDGSADASADGKARSPAASAPSASATSAKGPSPTARAPSDPSCVTVDGTPGPDTRRTIGRPPCRDAQILEWQDPSGAPRYACVVAPRGVETRAPLPLVVFFHGPLDDPTSVDKKTGLRKLAARFDLTHDPAHQGFIVLAPQGRAIKGGGALFDTDYTGPDNLDVVTVDHFVGELEARGLVDRRRVYALGASMGGLMASTWAMMRADRVAAFGVYGSAAPHAAWSCGGPPPPALVLYRACDDFAPCESVERWLRVRDALSAETESTRLGSFAEEEPLCAVKNKCTKAKGQANHRRWPKHEEEAVLKFFARHTLAIGGGDPPDFGDGGVEAAAPTF